MRAHTAGWLVSVTVLAALLFLIGRPVLQENGWRIAPTAVPRIVLITVDALRADHLGVYGYARPTSPQIDEFARESVVVRDAIAQAPYTKASIASLMTGLIPAAHKTFSSSVTVADAMDGHVGPKLPRTDVLPSEITTLAEAMKAVGYATAAITTNPFLIGDFGFAQGFDSFEFLADEGFAHADQVFPRGLQQIDAHPGPLFLWMHVMEPHSPYSPPAQFRPMFPPLPPPVPIPPSVEIPPWIQVGGSRDLRLYESLYDGEVRCADAAFGAFLDALRRRSGFENTIVVLTADHGEQFLEHGGLEHNTALYDELIRVPLIIRAPTLSPSRVNAQVQLIDLYPTLIAMAGGRPPPNIQGRDVSAVIRGAATSERAYAERVGEQYAVRTPAWKLIVGPGSERALFDLAHDPREQRNVMARHAAVAAQLERGLDRMLSSALRAARGIPGASTPVDDATIERLKTLGYVQP
jgi:choline-sulfatase